MRDKIEFWEKLAQRYPRYYDESMVRDVGYVLNFCEEYGVDFKGISILDIGCGTGCVAIPLALKGAKVKAIDVSVNMLDILQSDAEETGVKNNIVTFKSDWSAFDDSDKYDMVVASMTPAISSFENIEKMINATKNIGIYVGWGKYRNNGYINSLVKAHGVEPETLSGKCINSFGFMDILKDKNISYVNDFFETSWEENFTLEEAIEYSKEELKLRDIEPSEEKIDVVIKKYIKNDIVSVKTEAQKGVIMFFKSNYGESE